MVLWENDLFDFCDYVVQVDFPKIACGSVIESGMEIFIADQYVQSFIDDTDGDHGLAFLSKNVEV